MTGMADKILFGDKVIVSESAVDFLDEDLGPGRTAIVGGGRVNDNGDTEYVISATSSLTGGHHCWSEYLRLERPRSNPDTVTAYRVFAPKWGQRSVHSDLRQAEKDLQDAELTYPGYSWRVQSAAILWEDLR